MFANGQIPNLFAPQQQRQRVTYVDDEEAQEQQQRQLAYQQEYERAQALANQQQAQPAEQGSENPQFGGNSVVASNDVQFQGFDDSDDGVSYIIVGTTTTFSE